MRLIDADALLNDLSIVYHTEDGYAVVDVKDIKKAPTIKSFTLADIEAQYRKGLEKGLEETIRCAMCENSMKSERGCDGSCRYDEKLFEKIVQAIKDSEVQRPHGECNQCRYYEGVHGVQGHAPCSFWKIGGVLWNDFCSRYEKEGEAE